MSTTVSANPSLRGYTFEDIEFDFIGVYIPNATIVVQGFILDFTGQNYTVNLSPITWEDNIYTVIGRTNYTSFTVNFIKSQQYESLLRYFNHINLPPADNIMPASYQGPSSVSTPLGISFGLLITLAILLGAAYYFMQKRKPIDKNVLKINAIQTENPLNNKQFRKPFAFEPTTINMVENEFYKKLVTEKVPPPPPELPPVPEVKPVLQRFPPTITLSSAKTAPVTTGIDKQTMLQRRASFNKTSSKFIPIPARHGAEKKTFNPTTISSRTIPLPPSVSTPALIRTNPLIPKPPQTPKPPPPPKT